MNTRFNSHLPEDVLEQYVMGTLPEGDSAPLEEHLLVCSVCQTNLDAMDDYIRVVKAAASALSTNHCSGPPVSIRLEVCKYAR